MKARSLPLRLALAAAFLSAAPALRAAGEKESPAEETPLAERIDQAIGRGIGFLLADQNEKGSWGSPHRTKGLNIYAPAPSSHEAFRAAVTAMAVSALIESGRWKTDPAVRDSLERGEAYLLEHLSSVRRATADAIYNVWTHGYGIQALVRMHERALAGKDNARAEEIRRLIGQQVELLSRYESIDGGWGYYDFRAGTKRPSSSSISFVSATMLVAFHEAATRVDGVKIPEKLADRAIDSINRQRKPDNSYLYGEDFKMRPMFSINRPGGSLGRSQACNIALRYWGDGTVTDGVLDEWLTRLWNRNGWLSVGRKRPIPHESWFAVAGYFFYYGHYYAALCIEDLPEKVARPHRRNLAEIILPLQEKDGSWWDYPFYSYHQPYGTAFAVMTLVRCR